jgi:hypothetical protein
VIRPWRRFDHPQLGPVEIGGLDVRIGVWNPPPELLPTVCAQHSACFARVAALAPSVVVRSLVAVPVGDDLTRIELVVDNRGYLATYGLPSAKKLEWNEPLYAELVADGCALVEPERRRVTLGHLAGWGHGGRRRRRRARLPALGRQRRQRSGLLAGARSRRGRGPGRRRPGRLHRRHRGDRVAAVARVVNRWSRSRPVSAGQSRTWPSARPLHPTRPMPRRPMPRRPHASPAHASPPLRRPSPSSSPPAPSPPARPTSPRPCGSPTAPTPRSSASSTPPGAPRCSRPKAPSAATTTATPSAIPVRRSTCRTAPRSSRAAAPPWTASRSPATPPSTTRWASMRSTTTTRAIRCTRPTPSRSPTAARASPTTASCAAPISSPPGDADLVVTIGGVALRSDLFYHCTNPDNPRCALSGSGLELIGRRRRAGLGPGRDRSRGRPPDRVVHPARGRRAERGDGRRLRGVVDRGHRSRPHLPVTVGRGRAPRAHANCSTPSSSAPWRSETRSRG